MDRPPDDQVLARRARIARLTELGQRLGYGLFGVAVTVFIVSAIRGFSAVLDSIVVACLAAGSVVLAPAIVFGFAVKAAEREERSNHDRGGRGLGGV